MNPPRINHFRFLLICCSLVSLLLSIAGCAVAEEKMLSIANSDAEQVFLKNLRVLVQLKASVKENHIFIARYPASQPFTYMLWREQRSLWILELGGNNPDHWQQILLFPRSGTVINLDRDVVPSEVDIGTSTYRVDQQWVNSVVYETVLNGDMYVIEKK